MLENKVGRRIFGKLMNLDSNDLSWIEGVADTLDICNIDVPGFNGLLEYVYSYGTFGIDQVKRVCKDI